MSTMKRIALAATAFCLFAGAADSRWRSEWPRTDFSKTTVQLEEIESGGPPKDGIPNDEVGRQPIIVVSHEGMLSALDADRITQSRQIPAMAAYSSKVEGRVPRFERRDGRILDRETGSEWDLFGRVVAGALKGTRLKPVDGGVHFAFAWLAFKPASEIYGAGSAAVAK